MAYFASSPVDYRVLDSILILSNSGFILFTIVHCDILSITTTAFVPSNIFVNFRDSIKCVIAHLIVEVISNISIMLPPHQLRTSGRENEKYVLIVILQRIHRFHFVIYLSEFPFLHKDTNEHVHTSQ